jgi:peptidoglycan/LPS O-acetylase OafA/YrhL
MFLRPFMPQRSMLSIYCPQNREEHDVAVDRARRAIPSLDGLRALSVLVVILGHSHSTLLDRIPLNAIFRSARLGVAVFFVISGFLITRLLLDELRRNGTVSLRRFYIRRMFRIFPPFYVFLGVVAVMAGMSLVQVDWKEILAAATYVWNYVPFNGNNWILLHCWSLSLEEQFYLLWPACIAFFDRRTNLRIAIAIIVLSPFSRMLTQVAWRSMRSHVGIMLHTHLDTIMTGSLLALMVDLKMWERARKFALHPMVPIAGLVFLAAIDIPAVQRWKGMYLITVGYSLENLAIAVILLYVIFRHDSWLGKILNVKPLRHIGIISYGIYLWQQLFTGPHTFMFPLNIILIVACAELSYLLVEQPSYWFRDKVLRMVTSKAASSPMVVDAAINS